MESLRLRGVIRGVPPAGRVIHGEAEAQGSETCCQHEAEAQGSETRCQQESLRGPATGLQPRIKASPQNLSITCRSNVIRPLVQSVTFNIMVHLQHILCLKC